MNKIDEIFEVITAKSHSFSNYSEGNIPFISNGLYNNGVIGFVEAFDNDRVFKNHAICISAFCEATVQVPPFIGRGNGGSGMTILIPKDSQMTYNTLLRYASFINNNIKWRYNYGRMVSKERISKEFITLIHSNINFEQENILKYLPRKNTFKNKKLQCLNLKQVPITSLFELKHGDFHSITDLDEGPFPAIARGDSNNGITGYYDKPENAELYKALTITVSSVSGDSFIQLDDFIATDNVVILTPKKEFALTTLFFISMMINKEKWRWLYGRQCYKTKFATLNIMLPLINDNIDENTIKKIVIQQWGWETILEYIKNR